MHVLAAPPPMLQLRTGQARPPGPRFSHRRWRGPPPGSRPLATPPHALLDGIQRLMNPQKPGLQEKQGNIFSRNQLVALAPGVDVSPMGLGTWSWGNQFLWGYKESMDTELQEVFNLAVSQGVNLFDTGDSYGTGKLNGRSEQLLGKFTREYAGTPGHRVHVATKFAAYPWRLLPSSMVSACYASARRLGVGTISLGQLHWSAANYAPFQDRAMQAGIADCYEQGLVKAVGVSNYGPKQLKKAHAYLESRGVPLAAAQVQYSLLSCGTSQQSTKALCDDLGITLIAYSPLALGLLSGKYRAGVSLPQGPRASLFRGLLPKVRPLLEVAEEVAEDRRKTVAQVAINWCMCKGTIPIPGAKDREQANENLGALGWRLSSGEVAELDAVARRVSAGGASMVQNIFQTS